MIPFPYTAAGLGSHAGSGTLWTPANLGTYPAIWANPNSSVTDAGSGACSNWENVGTATQDFIQTTGSERPLIVASGLNGKRILRADGSTDNMIQTDSTLFRNVSAGYVFVVWQRQVSTGGGTARSLFVVTNSAGTASRFALHCDTSTTVDKLRLDSRPIDGGSTSNLLGNTAVNSGWHMALAIADWANGDGYLYVDGSLDASNTSYTTPGNTSNTNSGTSNYLFRGPTGNYTDAEMAEIVVGAYMPTTTEIDKLFGYAAHQYGLTANLPALHPYKSVAPTV